jgi:hypothetical protein
MGLSLAKFQSGKTGAETGIVSGTQRKDMHADAVAVPTRDSRLSRQHTFPDAFSFLSPHEKFDELEREFDRGPRAAARDAVAVDHHPIFEYGSRLERESGKACRTLPFEQSMMVKDYGRSGTDRRIKPSGLHLFFQDGSQIG